MKRIIGIVIAVIITMLALPAIAEVVKKPDYRAEDAEVPLSFRKEKTLPGGINVDFAMVTLAQYKKEVDAIFDYTFTETTRIAELFNSSDPNSDLQKINAAAGAEPVQVSKEVVTIALHAKEVADWTAGAFNPVNGGTYRDIKINKSKSTVFLKKSGMTLNLRWILEGFMADLYIRAAYHANLDDAFVKVGGVVRALGEDAFNPWRVLVEGAGDKSARKGMAVTISNYSAATVGGFYPSPAADPRTGNPLNTEFYSVTVLAQQAATAQGVATAIYIVGPQEGENIINSLGIRAIFAYKDGSLKKVGRW